MKNKIYVISFFDGMNCELIKVANNADDAINFMNWYCDQFDTTFGICLNSHITIFDSIESAKKYIAGYGFEVKNDDK